MAKKHTNINLAASSELRSLAQERLAQQHLTTQHSAPSTTSSLGTSSSPDEMLRVVHELEVQQIELELQQEELLLSRQKLEETLAMYTDLYDFAPLGYLTLAQDSTILEANLTAATMLGVERSRLRGMHLTSFVIPEDHRVIDVLLEKVFIGKIVGYDEVMLLSNNSLEATVPKIFSGRTVRLDAAISQTTPACRIILSDITRQKQTEDVLRRQSRALLATDHCNQALIHSTDELDLLHRVCNIMVEVGGYRMAWVGYAEHDEKKSISVLAEVGFVADYKQHHKLSWADVPQGRGPVGVTIRTAQSTAVNYIPTDPIFTLWRDDALRHGFASLLTLPLKAGNKAFGVLTIYSAQPDAFDTDETRLLGALADNLAYGISTLRSRKKKEEAENALRRSERNFRSITEQMTDEVFLIDSIGTLTYVSPVVEKLFGYLPHEVIGHSFADYILEQDIPQALEVFQSTLLYKTSNQMFEVRLKRKDNSLFDAEIHLQYYQDQDISGMIGLIRDISDRKLAESKAKEMSARFKATIDVAKIGTWDWNVQTGEAILNNRWFEIVGYSREELAPVSIQTWVDLTHPDDFRESMGIAEKLFNGELDYYEHECRMKHKNGTWVWVLDRGSLISRTADGKPLRVLGTHIDINDRKQAEAALRESERLFRSTIEQISEVVFVNNSIGEVSYVSPIVEKITGYKADELIGHTFFEYVAEEDLSRAIAVFTDAMKRQLTNQVVEFKYRKKDGSLFDAEIHSQYFNDNGSCGVIGLLRDISERKLFENQLVKLSAAVEQSPAVVVITDSHGTIEYVNPRFSKLTGYSIEEATGKNPQILQSGLTPKSVYDDLWKTILSGNIWRGEWQNKKKNGELFWESVVMSAILNSEGIITNFVAVKEDITAQKKMLQDLIAAKEKAEESDRLKSAFLANISHEIRTPMNGILGFSELLKEPHLSGDEMAEFIDLIQKSGHRMLNLINDLIDISRIDAEETKVEITETPLNELLQDIHAFFKPDALSKGLRLTLTTGLSDGESLMNTDSGKLTQILTNLVNNALKFTIKGGVDFGYRRKENMLEFYVIDSGIGIPVEMRDKVFDRFQQVDNSLTRGYEGAGLGLSITNSFVKLLGGKIHVESTDGAGTTFSFTLPYNPTQPEHSALSTQPSALSFCILIVEDDAMSTLLLKKNFKDENFCMHCAENGWEAVEMIRHHPEINLVLMDIKMPVMNGFEATRLIKQQRPDLPVIAQSAFTSKEDRDKAREAGCDDFITKPISKSELLEKMHALLHWE